MQAPFTFLALQPLMTTLAAVGHTLQVGSGGVGHVVDLGSGAEVASLLFLEDEDASGPIFGRSSSPQTVLPIRLADLLDLEAPHWRVPGLAAHMLSHLGHFPITAPQCHTAERVLLSLETVAGVDPGSRFATTLAAEGRVNGTMHVDIVADTFEPRVAWSVDWTVGTIEDDVRIEATGLVDLLPGQVVPGFNVARLLLRRAGLHISRAVCAAVPNDCPAPILRVVDRQAVWSPFEDLERELRAWDQKAGA